jgi:hypothetical protein
MLRIYQVMPINLNTPKKCFFIFAPSIPWGNILTGEQGMIWVLINELYIDFYLLYMVTYVAINSVDCMCTTDVTSPLSMYLICGYIKID